MNSPLWFVAVGAGAALTHLGVYVVTSHLLNVMNEWANVCGFTVAFFVSFLGHRYLSFRDNTTPFKTSLLRFLITAVAGFLTNESVFIVLLRQLDFNDWVALFVAIAAAAAQTFTLSRMWAFAANHDHS